ncbi:MAG: hypothetical protein DME26_12145 [Verrucomicrobia bacterium]|nr:MAG: hypothetical protein DME26_12145 [Verrucomicrobiota bacterium]
MVLYPFSLIYLLFPLPWSLSYFCLAHFLLGGMGMYFLAYHWAGSRFGASLAGFAYIINGATFASLIWPNYAVALGWMPWVVWQVERAWSQGGRRIVPAALVAALQILSGVPEMVVFTWIVLAGLWALHFVRAKETRWAISRRLIVIIVLIAGLTAAQILPFLALLAHSQRDRGFADIRWPMPGWGWANFLVPLFHCFETPQGVFFQYDQGFLSSYYLGIGVIALAILGVASVRRAEVWLLGALALFSLIMALGESALLYSWLKRVFPPLAIGRFPVKFVFLTAFAVPLMAAFAFRWHGASLGLHRRSANRTLCVIGGILGGLILVILWFAHRYPLPYDQWEVTRNNGFLRGVFLAAFIGVALVRSRGSPGLPQIMWALLLLVIQGADILTHVPTQNPTLPVALFTPGLAQNNLPTPPPAHGYGRVMISPGADQALANNTVRDFSQQFIGKRLALWSNLNLLDHVPKVNGSSTLQLHEQAQVQKRLYNSPGAAPPGLLNFLGVSLITAPDKIVEWTRREGSLPLVTVGPKPVFADLTNTFERIFAADFDPQAEVYMPLDARPLVSATDKAQARIISRQHSAQRIELEIETGGPCITVVAQSFYQPWRAYVDGQAVPIWRANYAFQVFEVPPGRHHVKVVYKDRTFGAGVAISLIALCVCGISYYRRGKD